MTLKMLSDKLARSSEKFVLATEIKKDCKKASLDYYTAIRYLTSNNYLERIFKGIFYIYSLEERKLGKLEMNFHKILNEAMKLKKVKNWYLGLETALKLNNMTHEYFSIDFIINDKIFRAKPIIIMGRKVKFYKTTKKLFEKGVIKKEYPYSDPEKTCIDLFYFKHDDLNNFKEKIKNLDKRKLIEYSKKYDKRTIEILKKLK